MIHKIKQMFGCSPHLNSNKRGNKHTKYTAVEQTAWLQRSRPLPLARKPSVSTTNVILFGECIKQTWQEEVFVMYVCDPSLRVVYVSDVWQKRRSSGRSVPVLVETNCSATKKKKEKRFHGSHMRASCLMRDAFSSYQTKQQRAPTCEWRRRPPGCSYMLRFSSDYPLNWKDSCEMSLLFIITLN